VADDWLPGGSGPHGRIGNQRCSLSIRPAQPQHRPDVADRQHPSWISNPSCQFNQHLCRKWDQRFESAFLQRGVRRTPIHLAGAELIKQMADPSRAVASRSAPPARASRPRSGWRHVPARRHRPTARRRWRTSTISSPMRHELRLPSIQGLPHAIQSAAEPGHRSILLWVLGPGNTHLHRLAPGCWRGSPNLALLPTLRPHRAPRDLAAAEPDRRTRPNPAPISR
jgi:hypothetical protein